MTPPQTHKIGVATATIIGINAMIGSGIFSTPAALAMNVGPAGILAYLFVVAAVWCIALSLARLSELFPKEGSFYTYSSHCFGHIAGLATAFCYVVGLVIAMGLLAQIAGSYLHALIPTLSSAAFGIITVICFTLLNMYGVSLSQLGQHILIVTTIFPILAITGMCLTKFDAANLVPFAPFGFMNILKATRVVIFGFFGFECASSLFAIVKDPQKNVPRALTYSIAIVGILYTVFIASLICAIPKQYLTNPEIPLSQSLMILFPTHQWLITIIHIAILSAILGTIHSMLWSAGALLLSLTHHISCIKSFVHRSNAQSLAVLFIGSGILITCTTLSNINMFFSLTALFIVTAFIISMLTLLSIKSEWKTGRNYVTILGILTASMIFYFAIEDLFLILQ